MDEEEIEGLLPRTDLDNASQPLVSTEELMIGGAGLGAMGFYNQTGRMPKPVINTSSPVTPTFQPPAVQGPSALTTTQPTTLTTTRPTALTTTRPTTLTNIPRATPNYNVNYGGSVPGGGARFMKGAGIGSLIYAGADIATEKLTGRGLNQRIGEDVLAPIMGADVFQNAEAIDKSMQMQADFRNETARLDAEAARQKEISDLIGSIPGEIALDKLRQGSPKNLQEAYDASGQMRPGIAPQYGQVSDEEILARREARAAELGSRIGQSYLLPDGTTEGRFRDGTKKILTPEEIVEFETARNAGTANQYSLPMGEYQDVPGTQGSVSSPLIGSLPQVTPETVVAPAPTQLIETGTDFTPEEQNLIDNNPFLPLEMRPESDVTSLVGGASVVPETLAVDRTNLRPITAADANNPAFEGMSAGEIVEAINAPGYVSPGSVAMPGGSLPTSRFDRISDDVAEMTGMAGDVVYGTGKYLSSPLILGKNYVFGTEDNLNPTLKEAASATFDTVAATPISDFMSGKTAASLPNEVLNAQDVRNVEFLNRQASPAMVVERPNFGQFAEQVVAPTEAAVPSLPPATINNFRDRGMDLSQFLRYEDDPSQRTEQFVDDQGRLRRRLTVDAATLQGFSPERIAQDRPLAPEFAQAEATGDQMIADLRAREAAERGEEKMSFGEAKRRARGDFARRGIKNPSVRMVNDLAKSIQAAEPERLAALETQRAKDALNERILSAQADALEKGEDPNDAKIKELRAAMLDEQLKQLLKKGLPQEITFEPGEQGTVVVKRNGSAIGYFRQDQDAATELAKMGIMGATTAGADSGDTVMMTDRKGQSRIVPKGDVQEALKNGYKIK